jgi:maleamate amidohydrolase
VSNPDERALSERGFGRPQGAGAAPAIVVVDFTNGFTDPASPLACDCDAALAVTRRVLDAARAAGRPVFYTTVAYDAAGMQSAQAFIAKAPALAQLLPESIWAEVDDRIRPQAEEPVLVKLFASAFFGTPLDAQLRAAGVDTVIIVGASTSGCVRASVVDALQYGYRVQVVRDGVADRLSAAHDRSLLDMDAKYADVVGSEDVIAQLARGPVAASSAP